jgi:hypothetical protein
MAHEGLWEQLEKLDCEETAQRAKCKYLKEQKRYILKLLNTEYTVELSDRNIYTGNSESTKKPAGFLEQLCLLAYLINAKDLALSGKLIRAEALPGGQFFFRGHHKLPTEKLENAFGENPKTLLKVSQRFDAEKCEFGDASISLYVLPRISLTIVVWGRCEQFDARASILLDRTAGLQLPLDALLVAINLTVEALVT